MSAHTANHKRKKVRKVEKRKPTLCGMTFGPGSSAESTVGIVTRNNVVDGELPIELMELVEMGKRRDGAIQKTSIGFPPSIALYCAIGKLQPDDDCPNQESITKATSVSNVQPLPGRGSSSVLTLDDPTPQTSPIQFVKRLLHRQNLDRR